MTYIPAQLRRFVMERASYCCEYCRISLADGFAPYQIDHIIAEKHDGPTTEDNLCLACYDCNSHKGSDIAASDPQTGAAVHLYHPRKQRWEDHFQLNGSIIEPRTAEGRVTVFVLRLNSEGQILNRTSLLKENLYPCTAQTQ